MARKRKKSHKHRTAAQRAATRKMIAANRRRTAAPRRRGRKRRSNPIAAAPRRRRRARVKQITLRSRKRKGRRRAKAVVRTRPRKGGRGTNVTVHLKGATAPRRRRRPRPRPRKRGRNPVALAAAPRRSRPRHHRRQNPIAKTRRHRQHHHRRRNPISGSSEFVASLMGLSVGAIGATIALRFAGTHAVKQNLDAAGKPLLDAAGKPSFIDPGVSGQAYNILAGDLPVWSDWKRLAAAGLSVIAPFAISSYVKGAKAKSFFQLSGFGALGAVGAKAALDVATKFFSHTKIANRLLAPEIIGAKGAADLKGNKDAFTTPQPIPTLAGMPRYRRTGDLSVLDTSSASDSFTPPPTPPPTLHDVPPRDVPPVQSCPPCDNQAPSPPPYTRPPSPYNNLNTGGGKTCCASCRAGGACSCSANNMDNGPSPWTSIFAND